MTLIPALPPAQIEGNEFLHNRRLLRDTNPMASAPLIPVSAPLIPVSEYLATIYEPDCDYVEGELQERNVGERPHGFLQGILATVFQVNRRAWDIVSGTEIRVQTSARHFRISDVCVMRRSDPADNVVQTAPLICIEVLSPEDRIHRMQERIVDYLRMEVEHIWLIDPISRNAWIATSDGTHKPANAEFTVPGTPIRISLAEVFAELDDMLTQG